MIVKPAYSGANKWVLELYKQFHKRVDFVRSSTVFNLNINITTNK